MRGRAVVRWIAALEGLEASGALAGFSDVFADERLSPGTLWLMPKRLSRSAISVERKP